MKKNIYISIAVSCLLSLLGAASSPFGIVVNNAGEMSTMAPVSEESATSELFGPYASGQVAATRSVGFNLPRNVLVLMVEFPNTRFEDTITQQDYLADPSYSIADFIDRNMFHLQSYYLDASKDKYEINYTVLDTLVMMDYGMEYYGEQGRSLLRRVRMIRETIRKLDNQVNFADYDAYIIFHSGAGKETDIYGDNPHSIPSSFINRRLFQAVLDPKNDDFPGLSADGGEHYIQEVIVVASHQNHKVVQEETNYSVFGLFTYLYGRQIGLPTLFGNISALGRAAGAGNFCVMGTGAWNASGYVPPYLSAWSRYVMGWEEPEVIVGSAVNKKLDYPFKYPFVPEFGGQENPPPPRLYKIPISASEYYLIENREQNPDDSHLGFTFRYLEPGEQDYYPPPYENVPRFNFMKNTYRGCDWDFYLPGYGGPDLENLVNGSGILIWHIDENIIRENFEENIINADPRHQGVTLIEADGIQHLRSGVPNIYMRGSPYDSFRKGHNDYFGAQYRKDGSVSIPYAESFYGNVELEIFDLSRSGPEMSFSVNFGDVIDYGYEGEDAYPIGVVDHVCSCEEMIFVTTRSGKVFFMINDMPIPGYPKQTGFIPHLYVYAPEYASFLVPTTNRDINDTAFRGVEESRLTRFSQSGEELVAVYNNYGWAAHPVIVTDHLSMTGDVYLIVALQNDEEAKLIFYDVNLRRQQELVFTGVRIMSNMMQKGDDLYLITEDQDNSYLTHINLMNFEVNQQALESNFQGMSLKSLLAPINKQVSQGEKRLLTGSNYEDNVLILTEDNRLFVYNLDGSLSDGFPVIFNEPISSVPVLGDISQNGFLDIVLVSSRSIYVVNYAGEVYRRSAEAQTEAQDSVKVSLGAVVLDVNDNGKPEIIYTNEGNRMVIRDNSLGLLPGYPLLSQAQLLHSPKVTRNENGVSLLLGMTDGKILRRSLPDAYYPLQDDVRGERMRTRTSGQDDEFGKLWNTEYGSLQRSASYSHDLPENIIKTENIFVKDNCYIFPSPLTYANGGLLYFNIMVSRDLPVEIKVFDISGKLVFQDIQDCMAYVNNRNRVMLSIEDLSTGLYFVLLRAKGRTLEMRFAVEK